MISEPFCGLIFPTIISTVCAIIAILSLMRLRTIKNKHENIVVFCLCVSVGLWSFNDHFYRLSWIYGKAVAVFLFASILTYAYLVGNFRYRKAYIALLLVSCLSLMPVMFLPGMTLQKFSIVFSIVLYSQAIFANILLYLYYKKHKTALHLLFSVFGSFMIAAGFCDTLKIMNHWPIVHTSLFGSTAFILTAGYIVIERGYLNTKGWADYALELRHKETLLNEKYLLLKKSNFNTIIILTQTIEAKDPYTRGHCLRVRDFSKMMGEAFSLDNERLLFLEYGAILHDIGKILVPGRILNKNGSLTEDEFDIIKKHPEIGVNILANVDYFSPIIPMIRHHHEWYNGGGYPDRLSGDAIPLEARIMAVADTYDAMTSDRPYRKAMSRDRALEIIREVAGTQLDPEVVKVFIKEKIYTIHHSSSEKLMLKFNA